MSSFVLKSIALLTMIIDHVGAVFFPQYSWIRMIGRISFPIYAFLVAEGYSHTRSKGKYILRMLIFAVVSELPYDMLFYGKLPDFMHQNILFELAAGIAALWCIDTAMKKKQYLLILPAVLLVAASLFFKLSYGIYGMALIICFWLLRDFRIPAALSLVINTWIFNGIGNWSFAIGGVNFGVFSMNQLQMYAVIAGIAIIFYNGQKGKYSLKWFFYAVYPVHLALLLLIRQFITAV